MRDIKYSPTVWAWLFLNTREMKGHVAIAAVTHLKIVLYPFAANATIFHD